MSCRMEVASDEDWVELIDHYGGKFISVNALKSNTGWGDFNGKNFSGFNALSGGYRPTPEGSQELKDFDGLSGGVWWTSTHQKPLLGQINTNTAWGYDLGHDRVHRPNNGLYLGKSVRCVKQFNDEIIP